MYRDLKKAALHFRSLSLSPLPLRPTAMGGSATVQLCQVSASVCQMYDNKNIPPSINPLQMEINIFYEKYYR